MARYWVGGTADWDGTAGSKWAATSGGAGGESVPTTADDVFFDAASSGTCTIAAGNTGAKSINCTGFTGTIAGSGAGSAITVAGSITLVAGQTYTHTGTVTITGTGTLITAGKTFSGVTINGSGITVTLGDALNTGTRNIVITQGTFDTAGYNVTGGSFISNNSNTRTITLSASVLTIAGLNFGTSTNLTFNANTSQINITSVAPTFDGGSQTFYNVSFTSTTAGTRTVTGANTFNNLSVTGPASAGVVQLTFGSRQTINGTLSTTGTAGNRRVWFRGVTYGIAQTLTVNATPSLTDADFRDIYVVGTAAPISGTRIGNRGACQGITFSTPKNVYWNLSGAQNWSANGWAPSSGGSPSTDSFPLPQDTAIFDNAGSVTGVIALTDALSFTGNVDMSGRTSAMTISFTNTTTCYGSWTNGSGTTLSGTATFTFSGEGTKTITSAGKTFSCDITVDAYAGIVELADALNIGTRTLTITNGTFDTKNYNVTAGALSSSNSNVRAITLGSSTVTLSLASGATFATTTNLTFNAGTSTFVFSASSTGTILDSGGLTFYDVSFTGVNPAISALITGNNTYRNLSFAAPSSAGLVQYRFSGNSTITETLTVAGASAVRRIFVRSDTIGTPRTLTVDTLSATDCDFRDITIAGTAAGSSPTRAGDCGGNSGITFPAPKTVYWNLSGAQNWSATGWAPSSGGSPDINNFPLAQDTAVFDEAGSVTGMITINAAWNIGTFDASARTSAMTLTTSGNAPFVYGDWKFGTGVTSSSTTGTITFGGRGTSTITSNGVTFGCPVHINCATGTVQLADALSLDSTRTLFFFTGTFDAVTYNLTTGTVTFGFGVKTIKMGSGTWTLSGASGNVWDLGAVSNLTFNKGTADIVLSNTGTGARSFVGAGLSYNKLTIGGATGTSTLTITGNNQFTELASTKTVAHTIALGSTTQTFGKWTVTGTVGNVVTLTGTGVSHVLAGACTSNIDYLAMGSIGFAATSPGEFYAGANSTGTAGAPVFRTAPPSPRTLYWVGGTGNWNDTARWSTSSGGAGGAATPTSLDDVVFDSASNATAYTATVNAITGGNRCKSLTITGPGSGNVTLAGSTALFIHDDVTLPATGLTVTYSGNITLSGSSTGRTFTTNGVSLASIAGTFAINGVGCEWSLGSSLTLATVSTRFFDMINGTFRTQDYNLTVGVFRATNSNDISVFLGSSTILLPSTNSNGWLFTGINSLLDAGTSTINLNTSGNLNFSGGNKQYNNVIMNGGGTSAISGQNTFVNLTLTPDITGLSQYTLSANQTVSGTFTCAGSSAIARGFVRSNVIGTTRTITAAVVSANDCDFRDITIAGAAAPISPTRAGDCGGNSGITFPAAKSAFRVGTNTTWAGSSSWALTSGGAGSNDNFPLAQDTAVINNSTTLTGTLALAAYNIGSLDASTRTTGITLNHNTVAIRYGDYTLGSGVTISGTSNQTFSGRGTQTFTSAGKTITFPFEVDKPAGAFELGDAFVSSNTITHTRGTFDAKNYNLTATRFTSSDLNTRTVTMGSGLWTLSGTGTGGSNAVWNTSTAIGLTVNKDTADILFSNTGTDAREFRAGSGQVYNKLTIGGTTGTSTTSFGLSVAFSELASTKTVPHTITFGAVNFTVGTWSVTGTSGNVVTVNSSSAGTRRTITLTNATSGIDFLDVKDIGITDPNKFYVGANSIDSGNNLNVIFTAAPSTAATGNMFFMFN